MGVDQRTLRLTRILLSGVLAALSAMTATGILTITEVYTAEQVTVFFPLAILIGFVELLSLTLNIHRISPHLKNDVNSLVDIIFAGFPGVIVASPIVVLLAQVVTIPPLVGLALVFLITNGFMFVKYLTVRK